MRPNSESGMEEGGSGHFIWCFVIGTIIGGSDSDTLKFDGIKVSQ